MAKLKITQVRSLIDEQARLRRTMQALGLRRPHHSVTHEDTPQIRGMLRKVSHLVDVDEVEA